MRIFIPGIVLISLLTGCHSSDKDGNDKEEKRISTRDFSITSKDGYSDIFLDSLSVEKFIVSSNTNGKIARRIRSFYNARNYQFAWFTSTGLTEQGRSFWNLHEYYITYSKDSVLFNKNLAKKMNYLVAEETLNNSSKDTTIIKTELLLTEHFIRYILQNYQEGEIKRKEMERFIPLKKMGTLYLADSILTKKHKDNKYYADVNVPYKLLQNQLKKYYALAIKGGWPTLSPVDHFLKKGDSLPMILNIKKRLAINGEMPSGDTSFLFNDRLELAIRHYQQSRGWSADGKVSAGLIYDLNISVTKRIQQILMNMDRMRWRLDGENANLIMVNIPAFMLHIYEGPVKVLDMPVVVGKEGHNTTLFTGMLNQVVFSPYWNVTPNITRNEILPAIQKDPGYLQKNNMEITGYDDGLPIIRQLPGSQNSLGKVKFLFPNSFNIYFHDTPAKALFSKDRRAYSHGCIRLSAPAKLAGYVLRQQPQWTPAAIQTAMNSGVEQFVPVKNPIPILITYYTAWVDEEGILQMRDDIYHHDADLADKMFTDSQY